MINAARRAFVRERADRCCEYCRLHEDESDIQPFHVEHVIAKKHGGSDDPDALCWACPECNWAKGTNLAGLFQGNLYSLFNPRTQDWRRHFRWEDSKLVGKTRTGIVTINVLDINNPARILLRELLLFEGRFPPED